MSRVAAVTTFHVSEWEDYARRMVESFDALWPKSIELYIFVDGGLPPAAASSRVKFFVDAIRGAATFRERHRELALDRRSWFYNYRRDVLRFCFKPFAISTAVDADPGRILWLDADTLTHTKIEESDVERFLPRDVDVSYLGRPHKHSECGFLGFDLTRRGGAQIARWVNLYESGEFQTQAEWHDSYLFDVARLGAAPEERFLDLASGLPRKALKHPFINCALGERMDHLKGDRKSRGRSAFYERRVPSSNPYWKAS